MNRHDTFTDLLQRHQTMLWRMCWRRANGDRDDCLDLMQEVSIALWENLDKLRPECTPGEERAWVYWQTRAVFDWLRRRQQPPTEPLTEVLADTLADTDTHGQQEELEHLTASLSPDEQRMIRLHLEGYGAEEIANRLGINRNSVYQRMHRAVSKMRRVALVVMLLLIVSTLSVAVVPQWRESLFHRQPDSPVDTPVVTDTVLQVTPQPCDECPDDVPSAESIPIQPREGIERLMGFEPQDILMALIILNNPPSPPIEEPPQEPTVSVNGNRVTISGVYGDIVKIYNAWGDLITWQTCNGTCSFYLFPPSGTCFFVDSYLIQIGDRPAVVLSL